MLYKNISIYVLTISAIKENVSKLLQTPCSLWLNLFYFIVARRDQENLDRDQELQEKDRHLEVLQDIDINTRKTNIETDYCCNINQY